MKLSPLASRLSPLAIGLALGTLSLQEAHAQCVGALSSAPTVKADITYIHPLQWIPTVNANEVIPVQRVDFVSAEAGPLFTSALLCGDNLDPTAAPPLGMSVGFCDSSGLGVTMPDISAGWYNTIWPGMNGGATGSVSPAQTRYLRGIFDPNTGLFYTCNVTSGLPNHATRTLAPSDAAPDAILDNLGMGLTTFNGDIGSAETLWRWRDGAVDVTAPRTNSTYYLSGIAGTPYTWQADTPGFTLPIDGLSASVKAAFGPGPVATERRREVGPLIPSRIAYGRISWDWLWHGTCSDTSTHANAWCLPMGHPRLRGQASYTLPSGGTIWGAGSDCTCEMTCPDTATATGESDGQVKYDFAELSGFISAAAGAANTALPSGGSGAGADINDLHLHQRSAIRVMAGTESPGNPIDMPRFLGGAYATAAPVPNFVAGTSCNLDADLTDTTVWAPIMGDSGGVVAQVQLLAAAMGQGDPDVIDASPATGNTGAFTPLNSDPNVFSVDFGTLGSDGEWTNNDNGNYSRFISGVSATNTPNTDTCSVGPNQYEIETDRWWSIILDSWMAAFPDKALVGKVVYGNDAVAFDSPNAQACYVPNEYVVGRRGSGYTETPDAYDPARPDPLTGYTGRKNGVRLDSWLAREVADQYWDYAEADYLWRSYAWKETAYQTETWLKLQNLVSFDRDLSAFRAGTYAEAYGYWDLEEALRFARARHLSIFNFKKDFYVPTSYSTVDQSQQLEPGFCSCAPSPGGIRDTNCAATALEDLLLHTGYRLARVARAVPATATVNQPFKARMWIANTGNAPPPPGFRLDIAVIARNATFDPFNGVYSWNQTFPRRSVGPTGGPTLLTRINSGLTLSLATDVSSLVPYDEQDPPVQADYSGTCATDQDNRAKSLESASTYRRVNITFSGGVNPGNTTGVTLTDLLGQPTTYTINPNNPQTDVGAAVSLKNKLIADVDVTDAWDVKQTGAQIRLVATSTHDETVTELLDPQNVMAVVETIPAAANDAWAYENDLDLPALCQAPGFVGCTPPGQLSDPSGRTHAIDFDLTIPVTGTFIIMYRFTDTTSTTNPIHMDVPHNQIIGDASTQRWVFLSQVTVGN